MISPLSVIRKINQPWAADFILTVNRGWYLHAIEGPIIWCRTRLQPHLGSPGGMGPGRAIRISLLAASSLLSPGSYIHCLAGCTFGLSSCFESYLNSVCSGFQIVLGDICLSPVKPKGWQGDCLGHGRQVIVALILFCFWKDPGVQLLYLTKEL